METICWIYKISLAIYATVFYTLCTISESSMCQIRGPVWHGVYLIVPGYRTLYDVEFTTCGLECLLRSECKAFNYKRNDRLCHLIDQDSGATYGGQTEVDEGCLFTDISKWPGVSRYFNIIEKVYDLSRVPSRHFILTPTQFKRPQRLNLMKFRFIRLKYCSFCSFCSSCVRIYRNY